MIGRTPERRISDVRRQIRENQTGVRDDGFTKSELAKIARKLDRAEDYLAKSMDLIKQAENAIRGFGI